MSVFGMILAMTQMEFVLIRMLADLTVNTYTNLKFMRFKEYSSSKYNDIEMQAMNKPAEPQQAVPHGVFSIDEDT
jgi:hypothetical protein